jgi:hypothetical protein
VKLQLPKVHPTVKKVIRYTLFIGISAFFIYLAFKNVKFDKLVDDIKDSNLIWVAAAIGAGIISVISRAVRWQIMAEPLGYKTGFWNTFHGVMVGYMVNFAIPRGGEVARAGIMSRVEKIPLTTMIGTIVAERLVDLLCMGVVLLLAIGLQFETIMEAFDLFSANNKGGNEGGGLSLIQIGLIGMAIVGILFLVFRKKIQQLPIYKKILEFIKGFADGIKSLLKIKKPIQFIFHSIVIWLMYYLMVYLCFFSLPATQHLGWEAGLTCLVMSTIAILLPAPGGLGTFHYFISLGLTLYGIKQEDGVVYATIAHASQMIMFIGVGAVSLILLLITQRKQLAGEVSIQNTEENN